MRHLRLIPIYAALIAVCILFLFPFYWIVISSLKSVPGIDLYSIGPNDFAQVLAIPASPTIQKLSKQCRKSHVASDRLGARCKRM